MQIGSDIIVVYYACNSRVVIYSKYYRNSGWHDFWRHWCHSQQWQI